MWSDGTDDDRDLPQEIDLAGQDDDEVVACPHCGREIDEDTPRCPYCGDWVVSATSPADRRSRGWFWPVMVAILVAMILVFWHGLGR